MTRSGDDYVRGLRDGRTVLFDGERVADVTTHPAFGAGIRTVAELYDLAHDPANRELMTYPSPRDGRPINKCWLVPRTSTARPALAHHPICANRTASPQEKAFTTATAPPAMAATWMANRTGPAGCPMAVCRRHRMTTAGTRGITRTRFCLA